MTLVLRILSKVTLVVRVGCVYQKFTLNNNTVPYQLVSSTLLNLSLGVCV